MKVAIYSRKSVYTGKGESIENQIEMCRQYSSLEVNGLSKGEIVVFEDEGFSAKNMDRPQFQIMLREVRQGNIQHVVCYRLDRISRNVADFAALINELIHLEVGFHCIKDRFETLTPNGRAMMLMSAVFAQLERETLAERVRDNMFMLARTGRWLGGTPPTGFLAEKVEKTQIDGRTKTACKLKYNLEEIEVVKTMYQKFSEIHSVSGVYKHLIDIGIKSNNGNFFSKIGIKQILQNPVYCIADQDAMAFFISQNSDVCFREEDCSDQFGLLSYNKRDYKKSHAPRQERSAWIIAIGKHQGIVTGKQWVAVQDLLDENKPSISRPIAHNDYSLLSGLIRCTQCGRRMFARLRKSKGTGSGLYDYICDGKLQGGTKVCDCQNLNGQQTDDAVCDYLMQYTNESSDIYQLLEHLKKDLQKQENLNPLEEISLRIKKCNTSMENLINKLTQPDVGQVLLRHINTKVEALSVELENLNAEKERLLKSQQSISDHDMQLHMISSALSSLKSYFEEMTIPERRTLIRLLVQKIEWDGRDLHIFIYGE